MKKVLVFLVLAVTLFTVCACTYVPSTRFMGRSQVNSLVKEYGTPQAEVTFNYQVDNKGTKYELVATYDLLLDKAPLAVIRFIQLANDGIYNDSIAESYNGTYKYLTLGRYYYKDSTVSENKKNYYVNNNFDATFKGEFASNKYREPKGGYSEFKLFSLAMYHEDYVDEKTTNFDTANGTLIMALADESLNSNNYAVFAHLTSLSYQEGDNTPKVYTNGKVPSVVLDHLKKTNSPSNKTIYTDETDTDSIKVYLMPQIVTIQVKIVGAQGKSADWSKLPQIGK